MPALRLGMAPSGDWTLRGHVNVEIDDSWGGSGNFGSPARRNRPRG